MQGEFYEFLVRLTTERVKFLVVGGLACAFNGFVRTTEDVDILIDASPENVGKLLAVLGTWGDGFSRGLSVADFTLEPGAIRVEEDFPLDIFTVLGGKTYQGFVEKAGTTADGIRYLAPEDLIEVKRRTHREKDQIDVLAMERILSERKQM